MKHLSLAARYRPQTFAQVAGQDTVKAVLSRAAAEGRPAPAYLLSGTRGVGKTTIARIFAKALNCEHGPAPEPCNQCEQCRKITQGAHVDVAEIDGASNNSVEDVRALAREHRLRPHGRPLQDLYCGTKPTCSRATPSTLCSKRWKSRRKTWSSSLPPPRPTNFPSPL